MWEYWLGHPFIFLFFVVFPLFAISGLNILETPFKERIPPIPPIPADDAIDRKAEKVSSWFTICVLAPLALIAIPVLHLCIPKWIRIVSVLVMAGGGLTSYWTAIVRPEASRKVRPISKFTFRGKPSFDIASMGAEAVEVKRELSRYEAVRGLSPLSREVQKYIGSGDTTVLWRGYRSFFEELARFLNLPVNRITLHENTTAAIRHVLKIVIDDSTHILTTDMEYGSVLGAAQNVTPENRFQMINIK
ncbi:MAG: hypothetical protein QME81_03900 [bacterium]|nr:hypothetical protein [bacterium]